VAEMNIMVFDVAAESGGAFSVLLNYYNEYRKDKDNQYIFILSSPKLEETKNIKILRFPWIKKSWLHRLYFDIFISLKLKKLYDIDQVISLQNIILFHIKIPQVVLVHNAIPFSEYKYSILRNYKLWIYQNLIGLLIKNSIRKANLVIVQTNWMRKKCIEQLRIDGKKIIVKPPIVNIKVRKEYQKSNNVIINFFYPANGSIYKNHKLLIDCCLKLKNRNISNYRITLTLKGDENKNIKNLFQITRDNELPIIFYGPMTQDEVFNNYSKSILLFPSYIETVGLPLIEARLHQTPIMVSNCPFSREILDTYNKVDFFNPFEVDELVALMMMKTQ
jgi:glycosyltransferase involved in cell wall biosynthesis